jgi:hypothetical protein
MATVEKAAEVVADAAEKVAEEATDVAEVSRTVDSRLVTAFLGGSALGVAVGVAGGYFLLSKKLKLKYEAIADEEIANMRTHYDKKLRALENREEKALIEDVSTDIKSRTEIDGGKTPYHQMYKGGEGEDEASGDGTVVQNVFINNSNDDPEVAMQDAWNIEEELANRSPDVPYVVHRNEHEEGPENEEYDKYTLTYFEGDDVLCRDDDTIIEDQDGVIGLGNLSRFGHGSGDPNIVYIRNDKLRVDIEVVHSDGKYATEVAGFPEDELQHSSMRRRSPRRSDLDSDR